MLGFRYWSLLIPKPRSSCCTSFATVVYLVLRFHIVQKLLVGVVERHLTNYSRFEQLFKTWVEIQWKRISFTILLESLLYQIPSHKCRWPPMVQVSSIISYDFLGLQIITFFSQISNIELPFCTSMYLLSRQCWVNRWKKITIQWSSWQLMFGVWSNIVWLISEHHMYFANFSPCVSFIVHQRTKN